jgi:hypothetical protein
MIARQMDALTFRPIPLKELNKFKRFFKLFLGKGSGAKSSLAFMSPLKYHHILSYFSIKIPYLLFRLKLKFPLFILPTFPQFLTH